MSQSPPITKEHRKDTTTTTVNLLRLMRNWFDLILNNTSNEHRHKITIL